MSDPSARAIKRKLVVPKIDPFVLSLTIRTRHTKKSSQQLARSVSVSANQGGYNPLSVNAGSAASTSESPTASNNTVDTGGGASPVGAGMTTVSAFANQTVPTTVTSRLYDTPELATNALILAGHTDDTGTPIYGMLTQYTNCITRSYFGSSGNANSIVASQSLQEACINRLTMFCEDVPPACPVYLGDVPYLVFMKPLELPSSIKPHITHSRKDNKSKSDNSALYYNPFLAQRNKIKENTKGPTEVLWVQKSTCKVLVCFSNPLAVNLMLSNVAVIMQEVLEESNGIFFIISVCLTYV